ncbi:MAG: isoprenylcysteine carboxylmethyltransferase family protein [Rhodobacteraceae bacterium]|nr:isoprenylcysteine carboxylmethyltransferase family protein [Paracoccaceae bacterium]
MTTEMFLRAFLATFFVVLAVAYSAKLAAQRSRDGHVEVYRGAAGGVQRWGRRLFELFRALILAAVVARAPFPEIDAWLGPMPVVQHPAIGLIGAALLLSGAWVVLYAHNYMGALWRSGSPMAEEAADRPEALLQRGPFGRSRNPIFLGVQAMQLGLFMALPCLFTLISLLVGVVVLRRQVAVEERDLTDRFGPSYRAYAARTPRWV